jgi:hypothetical protein
MQTWQIVDVENAHRQWTVCPFGLHRCAESDAIRDTTGQALKITQTFSAEKRLSQDFQSKRKVWEMFGTTHDTHHRTRTRVLSHITAHAHKAGEMGAFTERLGLLV